MFTVGSNQLFGPGCDIETSNNLVYLNGSMVQPTMFTTELMSEFVCEPYGVSVKGISLYENSVAIAQPTPYKDFVANVTVVNASKEKQTKRVMIYKNQDEEYPFIDEVITIEANSTAEFNYYIPGIDWNIDDVISAKIA